MIEKMLMKISKASFGFGGRDDAMIGLSLDFSSNSRGIGTSHAAWSPSIIECSSHCKWTEQDRDAQLAEIMRITDKILYAAKKKDVAQLVGTPVEVTTEGGCFKEFRVLTEVL